MGKVRRLTRRKHHRTLSDLLRRLNPVLRGWCKPISVTEYPNEPSAIWTTTPTARVVGWLKKRHLGLNMHTLVRRYLPGWEIRSEGIEMFRPNRFAVVRYRYRGTKIPHHGRAPPPDRPQPWHEHMESRIAVKVARPVRRGGPGKPTS